jgi:xylan 1,4-beta-xylosidase
MDMKLLWTACAILTLSASAPAAENPQQKPQPVVVDFAKPLGKIRALHGVNNGPVYWGANDDLTQYHAEAGFPSTRLHDMHWPSPDVVDVPCIFPIFDADADDPKYYTFTKTDAYLAPIVKNGSRITYRLGTSAENRTRCYVPGGVYTHPPKDYAKWAKICINIIRHYNEGWANGFHYNIKYWEIWNEPGEKVPGMWAGTQQQYIELYEVAAKAIKAHDPSLKVGGPATCMIDHPIVRPFLAYCRDRKVPLDFFTWHCYQESPRTFPQHAAMARKLLEEYGFKNAESHITEWHWVDYDWKIFGPCNTIGAPNPKAYALMRDTFTRMRGAKGAACAASVLMLLQDSRLEMANHYAADINPWSMFDEYGIPGKLYYAFVAFNQLMTTPNRVACEYDAAKQPEITMCAGVSEDGKTASILISNYGLAQSSLAINLQNLPFVGPVQVETLAVDATHEFTRVSKAALEPGKPLLTLSIPGNAVYLTRLRPTDG